MTNKWAYDEDRVYHGVKQGGDHHIYVELAEYGPTERATTVLLRELTTKNPAFTFNWGYVGTGPNTTARAVLTDALGHDPAQGLWLAFTEDFVSQLPGEWRIRRSAVLRWVRGALCEHGRHDYPVVLPPTDRTEYEHRPEGLERT